MIPASEDFFLPSRQKLAYVRFETREVEDRNLTIAQNKYVGREVDYALISAIGGKDVCEREVDSWFASLERQASALRDPGVSQALVTYRKQYDAWKEGQEIPENGTAVKTCPIFSDAQRTALLNANVRTLEDIADAPVEAFRRLGLMAGEIKQKAKQYLEWKDHNGRDPVKEAKSAKGGKNGE